MDSENDWGAEKYMLRTVKNIWRTIFNHQRPLSRQEEHIKHCQQKSLSNSQDFKNNFRVSSEAIIL